MSQVGHGWRQAALWVSSSNLDHKPEAKPQRFCRMVAVQYKILSAVCGRSMVSRVSDRERRASVDEGMISSESRMQEICTSGSMSGDWKRGYGEE